MTGRPRAARPAVEVCARNRPIQKEPKSQTRQRRSGKPCRGRRGDDASRVVELGGQQRADVPAGFDDASRKAKGFGHTAVVDVNDEPRPRHVFKRVRLRL